MNQNMFSSNSRLSATNNTPSQIELPDQQTLGPGQWFTIHKMAKRAVTEEKKRRFVDFMNDVCEEMRCNRCKDHMSVYMKNNSFSPYWNYHDVDGTQIGMFKWSWIFHNSVNLRLNKPYIDWDTAKKMYYTVLPASPVAQPLSASNNFKCKTGGCGEIDKYPSTRFSVLQALSNTTTSNNEKIYYKGSRDDYCKYNVCEI